MESIAPLPNVSIRRIRALQEVSSYLAEDHNSSWRMAAQTFLRALDVHGKVYDNGGSVCVVRRASRTAAMSWLLISFAAEWVLVTRGMGPSLVALLVIAVATPSAASAIEACRQARHFERPATHILSDVVRCSTGRRGSGSDLIASLLDAAQRKRWSLGATAANRRLIERFYLPLGLLPIGGLRIQSIPT